jgi:hypothetical protein
MRNSWNATGDSLESSDEGAASSVLTRNQKPPSLLRSGRALCCSEPIRLIVMSWARGTASGLLSQQRLWRQAGEPAVAACLFPNATVHSPSHLRFQSHFTAPRANGVGLSFCRTRVRLVTVGYLSKSCSAITRSAQFPQIKVVFAASNRASSITAHTAQTIHPGTPFLEGVRSIASSKTEIGSWFIT